MTYRVAYCRALRRYMLDAIHNYVRLLGTNADIADVKLEGDARF